jgi:hypothetical protein
MSQGGDKKVIKINPELFKFANNNTRKNKPDIKKEPKPIKIKSVSRDKTIKRDMLRRIRANQAEQYDKMFNSDKRGEPIIISPVEKFETEFNDTMDFMNKLVDKHKREQNMPPKHNQTVRSNVGPNALSNLIPNASSNLVPSIATSVQTNLMPSIATSTSSNLVPSIATSIQSNLVPNIMPSIAPSIGMPLSTNVAPSVSSSLVSSIGMPLSTNVAPSVSSSLVSSIGMPLSTRDIPPQPTYGCLKNGSLPTYRSAMNKTAKNITTSVKPQSSSSSASAIERIRARLNERANRQIDIKLPKSKPNKIIRRTYNVGKDKFRPVVGVLLPNRTIRNNVANKAFKFKHTPVEEIRKFLLRNGFIKVGSTSPNDVLYKMYESIMLIDGEVKNHNPDNLLYNFFNDKTP